VTSERRGQWIFYRLDREVAERLGRIAGTLIPGGLIPAADLLARRRATVGGAASTRPDA